MKPLVRPEPWAQFQPDLDRVRQGSVGDFLRLLELWREATPPVQLASATRSLPALAALVESLAACPTVDARQDMLQALEQAFTYGHPIWNAALWHALAFGRDELVEVALGSGADWNEKNNLGLRIWTNLPSLNPDRAGDWFRQCRPCLPEHLHGPDLDFAWGLALKEASASALEVLLEWGALPRHDIQERDRAWMALTRSVGRCGAGAVEEAWGVLRRHGMDFQQACLDNVTLREVMKTTRCARSGRPVLECFQQMEDRARLQERLPSPSPARPTQRM